MPLAERAFGGLAYGGEGRHQNVVEGRSVGELAFELVGTRAQRLVREGFQLLFQGVDGVDARPVAFDAPLVGGTEHLTKCCADHAGNPVTRRGAAVLPIMSMSMRRSVRSRLKRSECTTSDRNGAKPFCSEPLNTAARSCIDALAIRRFFR